MARTKKRADGRYSRQIYLGKDENGTRKYKTFYAETDREAQRLADEYRSAIQKGLDPEQSKATLGKLYDNLIAAKKAKGIGQKSLDRYADQRDRWGELKDIPAGELKAADFQRVLNELADWHDGKPPLSHYTLSNLRSSAKAVYDLAIPEVVLYNPLIKTTTPAGVRVVSIPKILVDYLKTQKDGCMYVLHNRKGERMTEQGWKRMWESYMRDLNVKYGYDGQQNKNRPGGLPMAIETFTPHQLRHTFCTLMYFAGVDVLTARDQMGHKDISVTLGIYTALDKKFKKKKINRLDAYLKKAT